MPQLRHPEQVAAALSKAAGCNIKSGYADASWNSGAARHAPAPRGASYGMRLIHYRQAIPNFGDDLNGMLWPALAPALFAKGDDDRGFVGIGTIIGMDVGPIRRLHIFSSGAGYDRVDRWADKELTVHCVRGPVTARLLGVDPSCALSDGAIVAPLVPAFPSARIGGGGTAVVPHFETLAFPGWQEACAAAGFRLIDPRDDPATVIRQIAEADLVLTESLHGAVVADLYGVPWVAFATSRNISTSKWIDWLATLELGFRPTLVPPPNVEQLLRYGRRSEPFGTTLSFTLDQAFAEFDRRLAPGRPSLVKGAGKHVLTAVPALQRLMGFHPARTAEALNRLAQAPVSLSREALRLSLRDQMMERLRALERAHA